MKTGRIILASILGGLVMFVWGAAAHMLLPLGEMGVETLPNDAAVLDMLKTKIDHRGFFGFPGFPEGEMSPEQEEDWMQRYQAGPRGVLIYDPSECKVMSPGQLGAEFASNVLAALLASVVLACIPGSRTRRAGCGLLFGIIAWLSINVSYWTWYRFPDLFTLAQLIDQAASWLLVGCVIALVLGRRQPMQQV